MRATAVVMAALLVACTASQTEPAPEASEEPEQAPSAEFPWVKPVASEGAALDVLPARVVQTADSEAFVMAPLEARVTAVAVRPGDTVAQGDPIATVVMPELQAAVAELRGADGELAVLETRRARLTKLQGEGLAVRKDVVALEIEIARAQSVRRKARAVLAGSGLKGGGAHTLVSPIGGVVVEADVRLGEVRHPDDGPLAVIRAPTGRRVSAVMPRKPDPSMQPSFLREGQDPVPLRLVTSISDASGFGYQAWFEPDVDGEEPAMLEASARGRVSFGLPADGPSWRIPEEAVGSDAAGAFVVVAQGDAPPARLSVEVLRVAGGDAFVRGALTPTSRVATDPQRALPEAR